MCEDDALVEPSGTQTYGNNDEDKHTQMQTETHCTNIRLESMQRNMQKSKTYICKDQEQQTGCCVSLFCHGHGCFLCLVYTVCGGLFSPAT